MVQELSIKIKQSGFTLLELMIVITIVAILVALGVPSFREMIMNNRITSGANELATAFSVARIEAIKRGTGTAIVADPSGTSSNEWGKGFTVSVWDDADFDNVVDSGEIGVTLRQFQALNDDVSLDSAGDITEISFLSTGAYNSTSSQTFTLCDTRSGETGRQFTLNATGTYNLDRDLECP